MDDLPEEAIKYQFTDHLGTTRYTLGLSWRYVWVGPEFGEWDWTEETNAIPETLTPYGSLIRVSPDTPPMADLAAIDPLQFTGKPRELETIFKV